jgi:hypothetical protein
MLRRLLKVASIVCLVLCVALMGMWARSYRPQDVLHIRLCDAGSDGEKPIVFFVYSSQGRLRLGQRSNDSEFGLLGRNDKTECLGFSTGRYWLLDFRYLIVPYWFLVLGSGLLAMIFKLRWPLRFKLRGMFALTTLFAVVLGMIAWLDRAWIGK